MRKPDRNIGESLYHLLKSLLGDEGAESHRKQKRTQIVAKNDQADGYIARVLLVEDNPINQVVASEMLAQLRCDVVITSSGLEACVIFQEDSFDLVFMDCQMPVMDGYQATVKIREWELDNQVKPTPIVALTANALSGDREKCLEAGMTDYSTKPFTMAALEAALMANLADAQAVRAGSSVNQ